MKENSKFCYKPGLGNLFYQHKNLTEVLKISVWALWSIMISTDKIPFSLISINCYEMKHSQNNEHSWDFTKIIKSYDFWKNIKFNSFIAFSPRTAYTLSCASENFIKLIKFYKLSSIIMSPSKNTAFKNILNIISTSAEAALIWFLAFS